jgi:hypothetical protein
MARKKKFNDLPTEEELDAQYEILKAEIREGHISTGNIILANLEETLNSLKNLREFAGDNPGREGTEKLLLARAKSRMDFLRWLDDIKLRDQAAAPISQRPRLELDEKRKQLRIDDEWHEYAGDKSTFFLAVLLKARGQRISGSKLEDACALFPRADKIIKRLPQAIQNIIEPRKGEAALGGYRIKPEYF